MFQVEGTSVDEVYASQQSWQPAEFTEPEPSHVGTTTCPHRVTPMFSDKEINLQFGTLQDEYQEEIMDLSTMKNSPSASHGPPGSHGRIPNGEKRDAIYQEQQEKTVTELNEEIVVLRGVVSVISEQRLRLLVIVEEMERQLTLWVR